MRRAIFWLSARNEAPGDADADRVRAAARAGAGRGPDLLRQVWAGRGHGKVKPKIVRAYVKRLRHRLGDAAARPAWIVNERGVGYRMPRPGEAGEP